MHHYPFHVGDYLLATAHLPPMADLVYRRLLDLYYMEEAPIPNKPKWVATRIRLASEEPMVLDVLRSFFTLEGVGKDAVWHQKRADGVIFKYQKKAAVAVENGKKHTAGTKKEPKSDAAGLQPRTRTRTSKSPLPPQVGEWFEAWYAEYPVHKARQEAIKAWMQLLPDKALVEAIMAALRLQLAAGHFNNLSGALVAPHPASWLRARRWEDDVVKQVPPGSPAADPDSRSSVEAEGIRKGLGAWDELAEHWAAYKARVRAAPEPGDQ